MFVTINKNGIKINVDVSVKKIKNVIKDLIGIIQIVECSEYENEDKIIKNSSVSIKEYNSSNTSSNNCKSYVISIVILLICIIIYL